MSLSPMHPVEPHLPDEPSRTDLPADQPGSETPVALDPHTSRHGGLPELSSPELPNQERMPHFGHVGVLVLVMLCSLLIAALLARGAVLLHLFSVSSMQQAQTDVRYTLGAEGLFYLVSLLIAGALFPFVWRKGFFGGLHWNGFIALRTGGRLMSVALLCFLLALLNGYLMPGPENTPIDRVFRQPGAAWLLFGFGITMAPFFEELAFRGFLLPALCTAVDWLNEHFFQAARRPADVHGNPDWSPIAMALGAIVTSLPFALMHAYQTGYSLGPFLLLFTISMVLCAVRLVTRSLAASVIVHATYNFLLFAFMLIGTGGFRHLENM